MKHITILIAVLFFIGTHMVFAQDADLQARTHYLEAEKAYQSKNYSSTLTSLDDAVKLLQKSNARIEALRIKTYTEMGNIGEARKSLNTFSGFTAEYSLYEELAPYIARIEQAELKALDDEQQTMQREYAVQEKQQRMYGLLAQAAARIEEDKLTEAGTLLAQAKPLSSGSSEDRELLSNVENQLAEVKEEKSLYQGAQSGNLAAMKDYLKKFTDHPNAPKVAQLFREKETAMYNAVVSSDKSTDYELFLSDFAQSDHTGEVRQRLATAQERETYQAFVGNRNVVNARAYLSRYPNGRYRAEVMTQLEENLFTTGGQAFAQRDYQQARTIYQQYKNNFPDGPNIRTVDRDMQTSERKIATQARIASRRGLSYTMFTYGTNNSLGFDFGKVNVGYTPSMYMTVNANPDFFKVSFSPDEEIPTLDGVDSDLYKTGLITGSLGLNVTVYYPLSVYAGAGVRYQSYYATDDSDVKFKVEDRKPWTVFPEAGLKCRVGRSLLLKVGAQFMNDVTVVQFGIGF